MEATETLLDLMVSTNQYSVNTFGRAYPEPLSEQPADAFFLHFPSPHRLDVRNSLPDRVYRET